MTKIKNYPPKKRKHASKLELRIYNVFMISDFGFRVFKKGQAALTAVLFLLLASTVLMASFSTIAVRETRSSRIDLRAKQSYFLAEAGAEDMVWKIKNNRQYSASQNTSLDGTNAIVKVAGTNSEKSIESEGNFGGAIRKINLNLEIGSGTSFIYGVQIGPGGLAMENNSRVEGSVYSNGPIAGEGNSLVTGDAFAASASPITDMNVEGNAHSALIQNSSVGKSASSTGDISNSVIAINAHANRIISSTVGANAYYQTSISGSSVGGQTFSGAKAPSALPEIAMPISGSQLDTWQAEAESGGTISSPCPYEPADGATIGPVKILCDLLIDGTKVVTMDGTVWVKGNFNIKNSAVLKLGASYGGQSGVLIVNNPENQTTSSKITVQNSAQLAGSGASGSYLMAASRNRSAELGGSEVAIDVKNSSSAAVYYAPGGMIEIQNNVVLKEATGYKIRIKNSAAISYESGLADINFSSGPTGGWHIGGWQEIR